MYAYCRACFTPTENAVLVIIISWVLHLPGHGNGFKNAKLFMMLYYLRGYIIRRDSNVPDALLRAGPMLLEKWPALKWLVAAPQSHSRPPYCLASHHCIFTHFAMQ
jgi:hypothetical protein